MPQRMYNLDALPCIPRIIPYDRCLPHLRVVWILASTRALNVHAMRLCLPKLLHSSRSTAVLLHRHAIQPVPSATEADEEGGASAGHPNGEGNLEPGHVCHQDAGDVLWREDLP